MESSNGPFQLVPASCCQPVMAVRLTNDLVHHLTSFPDVPLSITFDTQGTGSRLTVDGVDFALRALSEDATPSGNGGKRAVTDLYRMSTDGKTLEEIGFVERRLVVQQVLNSRFKSQIKQSSAQATEKKLSHRTMIVDHHTPRSATRPRQRVMRRSSVNGTAGGSEGGGDEGDGSVTTRRGVPPLRQVLVHILAAQPLQMAKIVARCKTILGRNVDKREIQTAISGVARLKSPGLYHLLEEVYGEVNLDTWDHFASEEERTRARQRIHGTASIAVPSQPASRTPSPLHTGVTFHPVREMTMRDEPLPKRRKSMAGRNAPVPEEWPKIASYDEYKRYRTVFDEKYKTYMELDRRLTQNSQQFQDLRDRFKNETDTQEKRRIRKQIEELFKERKEQVEKDNQRYKVLHAELKEIKERAAVYAKECHQLKDDE